MLSNTGAVDSYDAPPPAGQCLRAAGLVHCALRFFRRVYTGELEPLRAGGVVPLDMDGYTKIFGTTRLPGVSVDVMRYGDYTTLQENSHIVVQRGNWMFKVPVIRERR